MLAALSPWVPVTTWVHSFIHKCLSRMPSANHSTHSLYTETVMLAGVELSSYSPSVLSHFCLPRLYYLSILHFFVLFIFCCYLLYTINNPSFIGQPPSHFWRNCRPLQNILLRHVACRFSFHTSQPIHHAIWHFKHKMPTYNRKLPTWAGSHVGCNPYELSKIMGRVTIVDKPQLRATVPVLNNVWAQTTGTGAKISVAYDFWFKCLLRSIKYGRNSFAVSYHLFYVEPIKIEGLPSDLLTPLFKIVYMFVLIIIMVAALHQHIFLSAWTATGAQAVFASTF